MNDASSLLSRGAARVRALPSALAPVAPLLARLTTGAVFVSTGWGKVHNLGKVTAYFTELGIPAPALQATFVSGVELVGGAALLLGLGTRLASLLLASTMVVAILTAKRAELMGVTDLFGFVEWTYLTLFVWLAIAGPGRLSLDHWLSRVRLAPPRLAPSR